jgi:hypothetical protein
LSSARLLRIGDGQEATVAAFRDEAEVYEYLGGIFRRGMQDPVYEGAGAGPEPNVELFMTADTGNRFWLGKVILPVALAKGQVRAKGPVAKLLTVLPMAKGMFGPYREQLEAAGRADLLGA